MEPIPDAGGAGTITYSIVEGESQFAIDSMTGRITTKVMLDREQGQIHILRVQATDQGTPPLSSFSQVMSTST